MITVHQLGLAYVKATRFLNPQRVAIDAGGIRHDRLFALVEADGKFINSDSHAGSIPLQFDYAAAAERFTLQLPDGRELEGPAHADGAAWTIDHYGLRQIEVQEVGGPWTAALTEYAGRPLRLVRCLSRGGAIDVFPVTFTTTGSLRQLASEVGAAVDATRFRAGLVLDHPEPYAEDAWDGRQLRVGTALLRVRTAVPRCGVIGLNPASGVRDQDVMRSLIRTRPKTGLPDGLLPGYATPGFATYAEVLAPGEVAVGDAVELLP